MEVGNLVKIKEPGVFLGEDTFGVVIEDYISELSGFRLYEVQLLEPLRKLGETHRRVERFYREDLEIILPEEGNTLKVGDLVKPRRYNHISLGVVVKAYIGCYLVHWDDGVQTVVSQSDLEVISESR